MTADFVAGGKRYRLIRSAGRLVLFEFDPRGTPGRSYDEPTPEMIEAARKRAEARGVVK